LQNLFQDSTIQANMSGEIGSKPEINTLHKYDMHAETLRQKALVESLGPVDLTTVDAYGIEYAYKQGSQDEKRKITQMVLELLDRITPTQ